MLKIVRALHIVGVAMFLGSILGHITVGLVPGATTEPAAMLFSRQAIALATDYVTLPGLALLAATGLFMTIRRHAGLFKIRWLTLHQLAALFIVINAVFILVPVGRDALAEAAILVTGAGSPDSFGNLTLREGLVGAVNLVLALAVILLVVVKPNFGTSR